MGDPVMLSQEIPCAQVCESNVAGEVVECEEHQENEGQEVDEQEFSRTPGHKRGHVELAHLVLLFVHI